MMVCGHTPPGVLTMPVFLALALISGQPLNLVPDDCPQLPPYAECRRLAQKALAFHRWAKQEVTRREAWNPQKAQGGMGYEDAPRDPQAIRQWRAKAWDQLVDAAR